MVQTYPYIIKGIANLNGTLQSGITISIRNNTKGQTGTWTTDSVGEFEASLSDPIQFSSGYDIGDSITVSCSYLSQTITVPAGAGTVPGPAGQEVDLIAQTITETGAESYSYVATIPLVQASTEGGASATQNIVQVGPEGFSYTATIPLTQVSSQGLSYVATIPLTQASIEGLAVSNISVPLIQAASQTFSYSATIPLTQTGSESGASATQSLIQVGPEPQTKVTNITFTISEISGESVTATVSGLYVNLTETGLETSFIANISVPLAEVAAETSSITNIAFPLIEIAAETAQTGLANITELAGTSLTWMATIRLTQTASQLFSYSATIPLTEVSLQNRQVTNVLIPLAEIAAENGYAATFSITEWASERPTVQQIHVIITKTVMLTGQKGAVTLTGEKGSNVVLKGKKGAVKLD